MEITKSKLKPYGFTLKRTTLPKLATQDTYIAHMNRLPWELYCDVAYEMESGLHCHGVAYVSRAVDMKRFSFRGWHIHFEELYDPQQWMIYCNKHQEAPTPDMTDTPIEEDFKPPTKRMFPKLNGDLFKPPSKPVAGARVQPCSINSKDLEICFDNEFIDEAFIKNKVCKHKLGDDFCDDHCTEFPCIGGEA